MNWYLSVKRKTVKALLKLERDDFDLISLGREFQNLVVNTEKERPPSVSLVKRGQTKLKSPCLLQHFLLINYSYKTGNPQQVV